MLDCSNSNPDGESLLQLLYLLAKPILECRFGVALILPLKRANRYPAGTERNVMTGHVVFSILWRDKINQEAFITRMGPARIGKVKAGQGVLKDRGRLPRCSDRPAVTPLFDEVEFRFEYFKSVAFIVSSHVVPSCVTASKERSVTKMVVLKVAPAASLTAGAKQTQRNEYQLDRIQEASLWNLMRFGFASELILLQFAHVGLNTPGDNPKRAGLCALNRLAVE